MPSSPLRVQLIDPSAFTPPYDHALAGALARAGADVELVTSRFAYGEVPQGRGYTTSRSFYRIAPGAAGSRLRMGAKLAQHLPDMARLAAHVRRTRPDVVHFQWLTVQPLDVHLLAPLRRAGRGVPLVLTAHDVLPREPRPGQLDAQRRLYERVDAVVVHSEHGAGRLRDELGVDPAKVHVIPHGAFDHFVPRPAAPALPQPGAPAAGSPAAPAPLPQPGAPAAASGSEPASAPPLPPPAPPALAAGSPPRPLPPGLAAVPGERPVVLCFGLLRPYKGIDVLLEAWRGIDDAELWIVGLPKMDLAPLRAAAPPNVRFVSRFVADDEIPAFFERADLVVLPYREIDQSGVLFTALAFGSPLLLTAVGGFPEVAATGAAELVPPGDAPALHAALARLLGDPAARARLAAAARAAASGRYSWDGIAAQTLALYRSLAERG